MRLQQEIDAIKDIDINKTYTVLLNGTMNTRKAHIMYILDGYYKDERLIVFRFYARKMWIQDMLTERDFKFRILMGK